MSSFPRHKENIQALEEMGFDGEEYTEDDYYESWNYDSLTYLLSEVIMVLKEKGFNLE